MSDAIINNGNGKRQRIIIAGGGTGGHIFPAIAIANALKQQQPSIEILFVGALGKMEMEKVPQAGYKIKGIHIAGFNRSSLIKNIGLPFKIIKSFWQVRSIVNKFKPTGVIGVGGYSSFPVLKYAQQKSIPTFIHESNSFAGKTNMLLSKNANCIFVATEGMEKFFPPKKILITGNPVRKAIVTTAVNRAEALQFFGLDENKKTILVTGGSLGAKSINEAIHAGIEKILKHDLQLVWQTGKLYADKAAAVAAENKQVWANAFITQMENAFAAADIVVSRAGAMAIAELCVVQKPVVFVPYPHAAEDHQIVNAQTLVTKQAGILVKDSEAKDKLVNAIIDLVNNTAMQNNLKENIGKLAITHADDIIAATVLKILESTP
jgi:UDP-N-acetylglucosamine--N-acetylmuramyl-(pentapeptide) pyrophosphoryl-undecaprenol N-acetylglucosamine transferase